MYELVIFDCDGVLIDSEWLASQVDVEELSRIGHPFSTEDYLNLSLGRTDDEVEELLLAQFGIVLPSDFWSLVRKKREREFAAKLTPIEGVKELIQSLKIPCCVASSSEEARLKYTLEITGLFPLLEGRIFGRERVIKGKPEPDIFLYAAQEMDVETARCLVIEDSLHGVHAAQKAGMEVWGFCGGRHFTQKSKEVLNESGVSFIFSDMKSILHHF